ncbi:MAG: FtsX-like permease family protein [Bacteroidota bacterium]
MDAIIRVEPTKLNLPWLFRMAWRDSRRNRPRLILFVSSIILGIAALVAINSFSDNLRHDMEGQAKELLGADLVIYQNQAASTTVKSLLDSLKEKNPGSQFSSENSFASMALFPKSKNRVSGGTRLVQIKALEGNFPYYGAIETIPRNASRQFRNGQKALVDQTLMLQFNMKVGDSVKVGNLSFLIAGRVNKAPGQSGIAATVAPSIYIPMDYLKQTGLIQPGSRINYKYYFKFDNKVAVEKLAKDMEPRFDKEGMTYETVEGRKATIGNAFANLSRFLNLVGFVALLLGCVGVASAVHIYMKEKLATVAILRCLGAKGSQAFIIYLIQLTTMGFIGSVLGALLGSAIQWVLPQVLGDFLPIDISLSLSWHAIGGGILLGMVVSLLFALLPLLSVRNISPLNTLRASYETITTRRDPLRWLVFLAIGLFVMGFAYWQIRNWRESLAFTVVLLLSFMVLAGVAALLMWLVRKFFPVSWSFLWRQSLANLYRPNNQTLILIVAIGLGTTLITTLYFVQSLLISQVTIAGSNNQPNMILFDIQASQKEQVAKFATDYKLPLLQQVPIVTMRLEEMNGKTAEEIRADSTSKIPDWAFNREYRATYRDTLISSETVTEGTWRGSVQSPNDTVFISLEDRYATSLKVKLGDQLTFNVQGTRVNTVVSSFRKVQWNRVQSNFLVVFPKGVLEEAPQFYVLVTRTPSDKVSAQFQEGLVMNFPNISVIDLKLILSTLDEILDKVSFVIRFMALFSILTGLLVLVGSVIISKYQRIQESVLLRTLGASRRQILVITALEYFFLGSLAAATGILLSFGCSWALARFSFESSFAPAMTPALIVFAAVSSLTVIIGLFNSRSILNRPPLEILRTEV